MFECVLEYASACCVSLESKHLSPKSLPLNVNRITRMSKEREAGLSCVSFPWHPLVDVINLMNSSYSNCQLTPDLPLTDVAFLWRDERWTSGKVGSLQSLMKKSPHGRTGRM